MVKTTKWVIDPMHSEVQFKVKHLVISTVTGSFKKFEGEVITEDDDFQDSEIDFSIAVSSVDTNQEARDKHLLGPDFFDAEKFPEIAFKSTGLKKIDDKDYKLTGDLTIKGVTKTVSFDVEFGGTAADFYGNVKAGFEIIGKINRKDFNLTWEGITDAGSIVLGEEIKLIVNAQFTKETV